MRTCLVLLLASGWASTAAAQPSPIAPCPGLDADGDRLPLQIGQVSDELIDFPASVEVPTELAALARTIVGRLEAGGGDAYRNIGGIDGISLGYLQWNHGTGSLYDVFLSKLPRAAVERAPARIRSDLLILKAHADGVAPRSAADAVVAGWTSLKRDDPLVSRVRRSVRQDLSAWLVSDPVRAHQDQLVSRRMRSSYQLARAWMLASDPTGATPVDGRTLAYFFDLEVFNGSRAGLWMQHVRSLRSELNTAAQVMAFMSDWVNRCRNFVHSSAPDSRLYNVSTAYKNSRYWSELLIAEPSRFDPPALDLIVFGYLRALRSVGKNGDRGFPGIFQADVFNRRAFIAVGRGYYNGATAPSTIYPSPQ